MSTGAHADAVATGPDPHGAPSAALLAHTLPPVLAARHRIDLSGTGRAAGVMLILFDHDGVGHMVLTKRSDTVAHHRGEVSFPGGRHEDADADLLVTALRETEEEIAVRRDDIQVLGPLDDVRTVASGFIVSPWVGYHPAGRPVMEPQHSEIARIMEVPLSALFLADRHIPPLPDRHMLRYLLMGEDVWGLTARILRTFSDVVRGTISRDRAG